MKFNFTQPHFIKFFLLISFLLPLSGCLFEQITSNVGLCEECGGNPLTTADGLTFYRGAKANIASSSATLLQQIDSAGNITTVAGTVTSTSADGTGTAATFKEINAIAVQPGTPTYLYVADACVIRRVNTSNWQVTTIAGTTTCNDTNGTGTAARFNTARDLIIVGSDLYIATQTAIRKMNLSTLVVTTFAGTNSGTGYTDATGTAARFYSISGFTLVGGSFYVLDNTNQRIRKVVLSTGVVTTVAGNGTSEIRDGTGTAAHIGVSVYNKISSDGSDFLFFTDQSSVRKMQISTGVVTTIMGPNPEDSDGIVTENGRMFYPLGIAYTTSGIYLANYYGVRRLY